MLRVHLVLVQIWDWRIQCKEMGMVQILLGKPVLHLRFSLAMALIMGMVFYQCKFLGFNATRKMTTLRACNGINGEPTSTGRLYNHISFSSGPMPQIAQVENGGLASNGNGRNGMNFIPNLMSDSRNNASLSGLKRARERDSDLLSGLSRLQTRNQDCRDCSTALTHQLSLPTTYEEVDVWQFQSSVPCKIRAKRGCATHPRSIAERMRRTRISERMRKLQGLFPNIDKQTNTADMLDMAVEYIKDLQKQVKILRDTKAKCSC
uniref:BHLH domain-containing protein n=1 Tax=Gossypium raimondii TaxID=29730 RepID=A0A0D2QR85_GOSRA|nr:hypothetical protein B456_004G035800 [Gossypium raimondii]